MTPSSKRTKFWIDPPMQLRMLVYVLGLTLAGLLLAYFSMDRGLELAARQSERAFLPLEWAREALVGPFLIASAITLIAGAVMTVFWSHQLIGPLMVLTAGMRRVRDGDFDGTEKSRDTDILGGPVEDFISMRETLRASRAQEQETLTRVDRMLEELSRKSDAELKKGIERVREELRSLAPAKPS